MKVLQHGKAIEKVGDSEQASRMLMEAADFFAATLAKADPRAWEALLTYRPAERDRLASENNARLSAALELAREERDDKVDGLESDLSSALDVLWRRGDEEARTWIKVNYPKFPTIVKISGWM